MLKVKPLADEAFGQFGTFASLAPPTTTPLSQDAATAFWPDCTSLHNVGPVATGSLSVGVCQVKWRPLKITVCEYHTWASEYILPIDGDIYLHLGPPTADDKIPVDDLEVFFVPRGTAVVLKPGVWHHAPFATRQEETVNVQILLPPRTYANDCIVRELDKPVSFEA